MLPAHVGFGQPLVSCHGNPYEHVMLRLARSVAYTAPPAMVAWLWSKIFVAPVDLTTEQLSTIGGSNSAHIYAFSGDTPAKHGTLYSPHMTAGTVHVQMKCLLVMSVRPAQTETQTETSMKIHQFAPDCRLCKVNRAQTQMALDARTPRMQFYMCLHIKRTTGRRVAV